MRKASNSRTNLCYVRLRNYATYRNGDTSNRNEGGVASNVGRAQSAISTRRPVAWRRSVITSSLGVHPGYVDLPHTAVRATQ